MKEEIKKHVIEKKDRRRKTKTDERNEYVERKNERKNE